MNPLKMEQWLDGLELERRIWVERARTPEVKKAATQTLVEFLAFRVLAEAKQEAVA